MASPPEARRSTGAIPALVGLGCLALAVVSLGTSSSIGPGLGFSLLVAAPLLAVCSGVQACLARGSSRRGRALALAVALVTIAVTVLFALAIAGAE